MQAVGDDQRYGLMQCYKHKGWCCALNITADRFEAGI